MLKATAKAVTLTGQEQSDTMCGTAPGATVTLSGPCFAPPGQVATVQFSSSNGEKATISPDIECIPPTASPPCSGNTQGNNSCAKQFAPGQLANSETGAKNFASGQEFQSGGGCSGCNGASNFAPGIEKQAPITSP